MIENNDKGLKWSDSCFIYKMSLDSSYWTPTV